MASSLTTTKGSTRAAKILQLLEAGYTGPEIALKLEPDDPAKQRRVKRQLRRIRAERPSLAMAEGQEAVGAGLENLVPITEALIRRALRGRTDAAKIIFEMTGFHNPRVKHEHSGEISIKINTADRPKRVETEDSVISDAEEVTDPA